MPDPRNKRINSRKSLINTINEKTQNNVRNTGNSFAAFNAYIEKLQNDETQLDLVETDKLIEKYTKCGVALVKHLNRITDKKQAEPYQKLSKKLSKDYAMLVRYRNRLKAHEKAIKEGKESEFRKLDINEFFDMSTTRTVSLNGKSLDELKQYGSGSNTRYAVSMPLKDEPVKGVDKGEIFNGFFTEDSAPPAKYVDKPEEYVKAEYQRIAEESIEKYPVLKNILKKGSSNLTALMNYPLYLAGETIDSDVRIYPGKLLTLSSENSVLRQLKTGIEKNLTPERGYDEKDIRETVAPIEKIMKMDQLTDKEKRLSGKERNALLAKKKAEKTEAVIGLIEYLSSIGKVYFADQTKDQLMINRNTGSAQRNAVMSNLAEFFGCGEVVTFSEKMNLKVMENGKEVIKKGVMMMPAEGEDNGHAGPDSYIAQTTPIDFLYTKEEEAEGKNNGRLIKEIASLQFLDLICGNTDRHLNNFFCKFDEDGHVVGIQGIDNDTAFGAEKDLSRLGYSVKYEDLRIIPKSMADMVMNTSTEAFQFMLQGYGLNKEEISNVKDRFKSIKEKLKESERRYNDAEPGYLDPQCPRIVPDDQLHLYAVSEQLCTKKSENEWRHDNLFGKFMPEDSRTKVMKDQIQFREEDIMASALEFKKTFIARGKKSLFANLQEMRSLDGAALTPMEKNQLKAELKASILTVPDEEDGNLIFDDELNTGFYLDEKNNANDHFNLDPVPVKKEKTKKEQEKDTDIHFRAVRDCMADILSDPDFRKDYVVKTDEYVGSVFSRDKVRLIKFEGQNVEVTEDQIRDQEFEPLPDDRLMRDLPVYRKMENALETVNEYLYQDSVVETADRYQTFQAELQTATGNERKNLMKDMQTFMKTNEFKKYKSVITLKEKLIREMDRFENLQRDCYEVKQGKEFVSDMLNDPDKYERLYQKSEQHRDILTKVNNVKKIQETKEANKGHVGPAM